MILYWFLCVLIGILPAFLIFKKDRLRNIPVKWLPATLRFLTCFCTAALLLAPAFPGRQVIEEKPVLVWLQDNSGSMQHALGKDSVAYRKQVNNLWKRWEGQYKVVRLAFGSRLQTDSLFQYNQKSTDMSMALQYIADQYQDRNLGAVILAGDGVFNQGSNPVYSSFFPAPVYTIGLGDSSVPQDALISRIYANKTVPLRNKFELIVDIRALKLDGRNTVLSLIHQGRTIARLPVSIKGPAFTESFRFEVIPTEKGIQQYSLSMPGVGSETNLRNNSMDFFVEVVERAPSILILAAAPHPDIAAIKSALEEAAYKISIKYGKDIPAKPEAYSLIIAHQVPSINGASWIPPDHIPVWYILGAQTDWIRFARIKSALSIQNPGPVQEVLPRLKDGFSLFTLPVDIREVSAAFPPLKVPSGKYAIRGDARVLMTQQRGGQPTSFPLWIFQTGDNPGSVLCGTGIWRWRVYEYKHSGKQQGFDNLIRSTVSLLSTSGDRRQFRVFMDKYNFGDNEPVRIYAELYNENRELTNKPEASLMIKDATGKVLKYVFERSGTGYELSLGYLAAGDYLFEGSARLNGRDYRGKGSFRVNSVPLEGLRDYADFGLLYQLAHQHNGRFYTFADMNTLYDDINKNENIKPVLHSELTYRQWIDQKWFFFLILIFASAEWLLRKYWSI